jgi:hypothetical protein
MAPHNIDTHLERCGAAAARQGDGGQIDGGIQPAALGQPDGVRAFPATDVERSTSGELCAGAPAVAARTTHDESA